MNYYELLGIKQNATQDEIKRAYKIQMKKWHPDINKEQNAVSMSMKINEAKETLLDDEKRKKYDEYLKEKDNYIYQKYSNPRKTKTDTTNQDNTHETVTKWEYLKEFLQAENIKTMRKIIATLLVLLESFICFFLKWLIISLAFITFFLSELIISAFYYMMPIIAIIFGIIIYLLTTKGVQEVIQNNANTVLICLVIILLYISSFVFDSMGKKLISQKVFYFLYNKLDIYLFKKAVGYK